MNSVLLFQGLPSPEFVRAQMERLCGAKYPGQVDAPPDATLKRRAALAKKRQQAAYQMDYRNRKKLNHEKRNAADRRRVAADKRPAQALRCRMG